MQLVEESPPPRKKSHPYDWNDIARQAREKPGTSLKVFDDDKWSLAVAVQQQGIKVLRRNRGFTARTAKTQWRDGVRYCALYITYHPANDTTKENDA